MIRCVLSILKREQQKISFRYLKQDKINLSPIGNKIEIKKPEKLGVTVLQNYSLSTLRKYIDWTPFFLTWELKGKYPSIFESDKYGKEAKRLFEDANKLLDRIINENLISASGVFGLFPANTVAVDDIEIYTDDSRKGVQNVFHTLRSRVKKSRKLIILHLRITLPQRKAD